MRSRYSAFATQKIEYLLDSYDPNHRHEFDREGITRWSKEADWKGLEIQRVEKGGEADDTGLVEFIARFIMKGELQNHHEIAEFRRDPRTRAWYFVDGAPPKRQPLVNTEPRVGRNEPCPCGSGKKHKKCCGA